MLFAVQARLATTAKKSSSISRILPVPTSSSSVLFYFFFLRPRSQQQRPRAEQTRKVDVGERAQTIGGFVGHGRAEDDDRVTLRGASGVELVFIPTAIARKFDPSRPPTMTRAGTTG